MDAQPILEPNGNYRLQGKVMFSQASVSHSVHNQLHAYSATAHPCWLLGHLLR